MDLLIIPIAILLLILCVLIWIIYNIQQKINFYKKHTYLVKLWNDRRELLLQHIHLEYLNTLEKHNIWKLIHFNEGNPSDRVEQEKALSLMINHLHHKMTINIIKINQEIIRTYDDLNHRKNQIHKRTQAIKPLRKIFEVKESQLLI